MDILSELEKLKRSHDYCEDSWYSCPLSSEGCGDPHYPKDKCNCGTDNHNEKLNELIKKIEYLLCKINKVTAPHRHGNTILKRDLDALSNYQVELEMDNK